MPLAFFYAYFESSKPPVLSPLLTPATLTDAIPTLSRLYSPPSLPNFSQRGTGS